MLQLLMPFLDKVLVLHSCKITLLDSSLIFLKFQFHIVPFGFLLLLMLVLRLCIQLSLMPALNRLSSFRCEPSKARELLPLDLLLRLEHLDARRVRQQPRQDGGDDREAAGKGRSDGRLEQLLLVEDDADHGSNPGAGAQEPETMNPENKRKTIEPNQAFPLECKLQVLFSLIACLAPSVPTKGVRTEFELVGLVNLYLP